MRLFKSFNKFKNNIAIIDKENSDLSYKQVLTKTNELKKKIKKRSLILIISENSLGSLLAYIYCIINNHVGIVISSKTTKNNILKIFKNYQPNYIFLSKKIKSIFKKVCTEGHNFLDQSLMKNKINKKKKITQKFISFIIYIRINGSN